MKEIRDIIKAFDEAQKQGRQTALATVVHVEGSSYRREGARMLITDEGQLTGAISGGCLEGDALRKAQLVMAEKRAMLVTYDTMDDDDAKFGVGLGCNGIIQVLIEPVDPALDDHPVALLKKVSAKRQQSVVVTLFSLQQRKGLQPGTCLLICDDGTRIDKTPFLPVEITNDAKLVLQIAQSSVKTYHVDDNVYIAFLELVKPAISLVIAGAGNDAMPLIEMAGVLGWETTLADGRANYAKRERFPLAGTILVAKPADILPQVPVDNQTVFILLTHNYNYDKAFLRLLLESKAAYAGMLGPRKKLERMLVELEEEGLSLSNEQLAAIHSPVGLDIGAETAEEIALSILAEIKAVLSGKHGQFLKTNELPIHARSSL